MSSQSGIGAFASSAKDADPAAATIGQACAATATWENARTAMKRAMIQR
jgi:hypothetical protein